MSELIEIEESFDPLREEGETLKHWASKTAGRPEDPSKAEELLKDYARLSDLKNLESGQLFGDYDEGDHVKAAHRENGFELSLLAILYRIESQLGRIADSMDERR